MSFQVEIKGIRIYSYFFYNIDKPIKIEAETNTIARSIIDNIFHTLPQEYQNSKIVGETVLIPIKGISEKIKKGIKYVWVGEEHAKGGWMDEKSYLNLIKKH